MCSTSTLCDRVAALKVINPLAPFRAFSRPQEPDPPHPAEEYLTRDAVRHRAARQAARETRQARIAPLVEQAASDPQIHPSRGPCSICTSTAGLIGPSTMPALNASHAPCCSSTGRPQKAKYGACSWPIAALHRAGLPGAHRTLSARRVQNELLAARRRGYGDPACFGTAGRGKHDADHHGRS